ncbi:hypothetical protein PROFUN_11420 [Planoprotostelium fungivorum]|uniref:TTK family protein kinase n=1 Tax=Planoprotostelium fungivorum TaxID=1890364 RepID=A0A2P6NA76_9EUKA|nr:hypothetical protein PROFUN_11420 [Planoprotostelium fungivorum]
MSVSGLTRTSSGVSRHSVEQDWESGSPELNEAAQRERAALIQKIKERPEHPSGWFALLAFELKVLRQATKPTSTQPLLRLYERATKSINRSEYRKTPDLLNIYIGYAKALAGVNPTDARRTFKFLGVEGIGQDQSQYYIAYATFEMNQGSRTKAQSVIDKGKQKRVLSAEDIQALEEKMRCIEKENQSCVPAAVPTPNTQSQPRESIEQKPAPLSVLEEKKTPSSTAETSVPVKKNPAPRRPQRGNAAMNAAILAEIDKERIFFASSTYTARDIPITTLAANPTTSITTSTHINPQSINTQSINTHINHLNNHRINYLLINFLIKSLSISPHQSNSMLKRSGNESSVTQTTVASTNVASISTSSNLSVNSSLSSHLSSRDQQMASREQVTAREQQLTPRHQITQHMVQPQYQQPMMYHQNIPQYNVPQNNLQQGNSMGMFQTPQQQRYGNPNHAFQTPGSTNRLVRQTENAHSPSIFDAVVHLAGDEMIYVKGKPYLKLKCIGKGGSSQVYRVMDRNLEIYALKIVTPGQEEQGLMDAFVNEVEILQKLKGNPHVVQLIDHELSSESILMIQELGELDLSKFMTQNPMMNMNHIRLFWQQMLESGDPSDISIQPSMTLFAFDPLPVAAAHDAGVIHTDLKPANFVFFKGKLKLIDFGIARSIPSDTTNVTTDSKLGTINYMSPESLQDMNEGCGAQRMKLGKASDVWALGCILHQLHTGKTPFASITNIVRKMNAITDPQYIIKLGAVEDRAALEVIQMCLQRPAKSRPTLQQLLEHPYLHPHKYY